MEIFPNKGLYAPHEPIDLTIVCEEDASSYFVEFYSLDKRIKQFHVRRAGRITKLVLPPFTREFGGFGVVCTADTTIQCSTAFDVQDGRQVFRYGFLSDFSENDRENSDILCMAKHHVNAVQFYDWAYRHDTLVSDQNEYADLMGKQNSLTTIRGKISECQNRGMLALGYGAVYAASEAFAQEHGAWRLYSGKEPIHFIKVFSLMNLRSPWRQHIIEQYSQAIRNVGFDGIHMDTYGFPKTAFDNEGKVIHLEEDFPALIAETRRRLSDACLVFNNVGGWPLEETMWAETDAVYVEVWPPLETYGQLKALILKAKEAHKPVVLAAYPAFFRTEEAERALNAQLVLMGVIAAHGATQLWFGEENAALTQGYYADYSPLSREQELLLRRYDDFFVRYEELFYDDSLKDVSMTHFGWDNEEYRCSAAASVDGSPNKLWLILREGNGKKLISIVNLCGDSSDLWAKGRDDASVQRDIEFLVQVFGKIKTVFTASPDFENGNAVACSYEITQGDRSPVLKINLPQIQHFAMIYIETEETQ